MACRTVLVRTSPRGVVTVIQPSWSLSDTVKAGVFAWRLTLPVDNNILNIAWTNLYGHLYFIQKSVLGANEKMRVVGTYT